MNIEDKQAQIDYLGEEVSRGNMGQRRNHHKVGHGTGTKERVGKGGVALTAELAGKWKNHSEPRGEHGLLLLLLTIVILIMIIIVLTKG